MAETTPGPNPFQRERRQRPWGDPLPLGVIVNRPFPLEALPPVLRIAVEHIAASRIVHPAVPFTAYLGAISGVLADATTVQVSPTWTMPVNLYALCVATSGDGKSPGFDPALDLVARIEERRCELVGIEVAEASARLIELTDEINEAAGKGKGKDRPPRDPMKLRRLITERDEAEGTKRRTGRLSVQDATPESTAGLMARNGGALVAVDAEGSIVHHALGLYSSSPNIGLWLAGWSGERYVRDRIREDGASEVIIPHARIGVGAAIQPGVLRELLNDPRVEDRGFLARCLTDWPPPSAGHRFLGNLVHHPEDRKYLDPLHDRVLDRWEVSYDMPRMLVLSDEARALFTNWHDRWESTLTDADESQAKAVPKVRASVARIAAIFHDLTDDDPSSMIEETTMRDAITVGDYYLDRRQHSTETAMLADARHVLDWLGTLGTAKKPVRTTTVRDVRRGARWHRHAGGAQRTLAALAVLAEHGWIQPLKGRSGFGSGISVAVELHPKLRGILQRQPQPPVPAVPAVPTTAPIATLSLKQSHPGTAGTHGTGGRGRQREFTDQDSPPVRRVIRRRPA